MPLFETGETVRPNERRNVRERALYRQKQGLAIANRLESVANGDPAILTEVDILRESLRAQNIFLAADLNRENGELYDGLGVLSTSGSRLDPFYRFAEKCRTRKRIGKALERVGPRSKDEQWWLVTLTLPTLVGVACGNVIQLVQRSWALLRKRKWLIGVVRAGIKAIEFTVGDEKRLIREKREWDRTKDGYHVHIHLLVLSKPIEWETLGEEWTQCLKNAGMQSRINTRHGRVVVDVTPVSSPSEGVPEICKYITKTESLKKIPSGELYGIHLALKGRRIVELLRECRNQSNVHTHRTSDGSQLMRGPGRASTRRKCQPSLRQLGPEMIAQDKRTQFQQEVRARFTKNQAVRRAKLAERFPMVKLFTLDGQVTYGAHISDRMTDASIALDLFASIGVREFAVTMLKDHNPTGRRGVLYERLPTLQLRQLLPNYVKHNLILSESLIVRPIADHLIQIDDCNNEMVQRLTPFSFEVVETSAENYQVWLALSIDTTKLERDAIRSRVLAALPGVDRNASGAMRWPGSINHKPGRNEFCVRIVNGSPARTVTPAELELAGLLSPATRTVPKPQLHTRFEGTGFSWPDYERCINEAPRKFDGSPDRSIADKNWAILGLGRGIPEEAVESKLAELSEKAKGRADYVRRTVAYASSVASRNSLPRPILAFLKQLEVEHERATL